MLVKRYHNVHFPDPKISNDRYGTAPPVLKFMDPPPKRRNEGIGQITLLD